MSRNLRQGRALPFLPLICTIVFLSLARLSSAQSLPSGWSSRDIGGPAPAGRATSSSGTFSVTAGGRDIWDTSDQFHFAYQQVTGDVDIRARVTSIDYADLWSKAGVMVRDGLLANARHAYTLVSADAGLAFQRRTATGGESSHTSGGYATAPRWVRLVRSGNSFTSYVSTDGSQWTTVDTQSITMASTVYVGLAVTSHADGTPATGTFTNVTVTGSSGGGGGGGGGTTLPAPWVNRDIGSPAVSGSATASGTAFTIRGAGEDIWNYSDQFQFVYQPVSGDTEIIARVTSLGYADTWSKAGVMIRESLNANSRHAFMLASAGAGWAFQRRLATGGESYHTGGPGGAAPGWVRLVREGNLFSAYHSTDGASWRLVDTESISMGSSVYVGLAVTSHNAGESTTGGFSDVTVRAPDSGTNQPPIVSISSPSSGASFTAPASITIAAAASDTDGTVSRVDFFNGSQLIGSDASSPYSVNWTNVAQGTYSLTAVASDNGGASTTSAAVSIAVRTASTTATTIVFTASTDHATLVTSYRLAIYRGSDPVTATPAATRDLGKPTPTSGEITVDVSSTVNPLPSGTYYAVVSAIGTAGASSSDPSSPFSK